MGKTLVLLSLLVMGAVNASDDNIRPFVKGSFEQIKQEHAGQAFIVTFWSETCVFCMKELAMFGSILTEYPHVAVVSITTDPFLDDQTVNQILASKQLQNAEKWVFADDYVERLYFSIDRQWRGELPLSYFFSKTNDTLKQLGAIKESEFVEWLSKQN